MKGKLALLTTFLAAVLFVAFTAGTFAAKPKTNPSRTFSLPDTARQVAPNAYYLGSVQHEGRLAEGYAFVDNRGKSAKAVCGNDICEPGENAKKCSQDCGGGGDPGGDPDPTGTESCYGFLANGARWKGNPETYVVNAANSGLSSSFVNSNLAGNITKWEDAAGSQILGTGGTTTETLVADTQSMDDKKRGIFC